MLADNTCAMLRNQTKQFYSVVVGELISTTISGIIAVVLVGFILIEHWTATLFVLPLTLVLYIDLLGEQSLGVLLRS
jgi:multidrug efflux pump subunit AcrB